MDYTLISGRKIADEIEQELTQKVKTWKESGNRAPHLAAVLVGNDGGSETYVKNKVLACERVGFSSTLIKKPESISQSELLEVVNGLNNNDEIDGFIVQLPLPEHINEQEVIEAVHPDKDVDGFHPVNVGKMMLGLKGFLPATPAGIMELIKRYSIPTAGKNCVVIGRSNIVGSPVSVMMSRNQNPGNCTVTLTHSKTKDLEEFTRNADIIIAAIGKPGFVTREMVKPGAVIIDVGTTRVKDDTRKSGYRLMGDVDFENVAPLCSHITPVPGGVGPMTISSLLQNCWIAATEKFN